MNTTLKIQKNIPIPLKKKGGNEKINKYRQAFIKMKIGDSFVIGKKEYFDFHNATRNDKSFKAWKFISRTISKTQKRVWRIK